MARNKINEQPCPYNIGVKCDMGARDYDCASCGWFPMEDHRRHEVLRKLAKLNCLRKEMKRHV